MTESEPTTQHPTDEPGEMCPFCHAGCSYFKQPTLLGEFGFEIVVDERIPDGELWIEHGDGSRTKITTLDVPGQD